MVSLILPYPPSVNTYWRANGHRRFISAEGRKFKEDVAEYVAAHQLKKFGAAALDIIMVLRPRDKRKTDIDNRIKAVLDALQDAGVYDDDCQIEKLTVERGKPLQGGSTVVFIQESTSLKVDA